MHGCKRVVLNCPRCTSSTGDASSRIQVIEMTVVGELHEAHVYASALATFASLGLSTMGGTCHPHHILIIKFSWALGHTRMAEGTPPSSFHYYSE